VLNEHQFSDIYHATKEPGTGTTVNVHTGQQVPRSGWAVATAGREHLEPTKSYGPHVIKEYSRQHEAALHRVGHLGVWHQPKEGAYLDVSEVHPESYRGGVHAIASGYRNKQLGVYHMGGEKTLWMAPKTQRQRRETGGAMRSLRKQQPAAPVISEMSSESLRQALRKRA
jgi:hypothetical protein